MNMKIETRVLCLGRNTFRDLPRPISLMSVLELLYAGNDDQVGVLVLSMETNPRPQVHPLKTLIVEVTEASCPPETWIYLGSFWSPVPRTQLPRKLLHAFEVID